MTLRGALGPSEVEMAGSGEDNLVHIGPCRECFSAKKPQPMTPTLSGDGTMRSSMPCLVDFAGFLQRVPHRTGIEAMSARAVENDLFSPRYKVDGLWQRAYGLRRNDNRTVNIGV